MRRGKRVCIRRKHMKILEKGTFLMREILKDIYLIEGIGTANIYLLKMNKGFALIDTGIFKKTQKLINLIEDNGFKMADLKIIILTHCHCDHIGGAAELVKASQAGVAANADDIPFIL